MVDALAVFQAFAAGVLSFFAPCSVAMLPAYISYYLGREIGAMEAPPEPERVTDRGRVGDTALMLLGGVLVLAALLDVVDVGSGTSALGPRQFLLMAAGTAAVLWGALRLAPTRASRGVRLGLATSAGILAVFALLGVPFYGLLGAVSFGTQTLFVLGVAVAMVALGVLGLLGKDLSVTVAVRAPKRRDAAHFALFGVAYGLVALGCNLPLFLLAALGPLVRAADPLTGILAVVAYGAGMALLMVALSVSLALSRGLTETRLRIWVPRVKTAGHLVLIVAGLYIAWYDLTVLRLGS